MNSVKKEKMHLKKNIQLTWIRTRDHYHYTHTQKSYSVQPTTSIFSSVPKRMLNKVCDVSHGPTIASILYSVAFSRSTASNKSSLSSKCTMPIYPSIRNTLAYAIVVLYDLHPTRSKYRFQHSIHNCRD